MIKKYSQLKKAKSLPPASSTLMQELGVRPEATQRGTTSYLVFEQFVEKWMQENKGKKPIVVDIGAGRGMNVRNLEAKGIQVIAVEPSADPKEWGNRTPDHLFSSEAPSKKADLIFNSYVLNVVPEDVARGILQDIGRILKPGGKALLITRGDDVGSAKAVSHPEYGILEWNPLEKVTKSEGQLTYQKGFTYNTLSALIQEELSGFQVMKYPGSSAKSVRVVVEKPKR